MTLIIIIIINNLSSKSLWCTKSKLIFLCCAGAFFKTVIWLFALSKNPKRAPSSRLDVQCKARPHICLKSKVRLQISVSRSEACLSGGKCYCNTVLLKQKSVVFPIVPCIPRRAASLLLCAFVSRRCALLLSFKCTMQDPKPRCIQNESPGKRDGQPQELRIHTLLSPLSAPCAPYTHKSSSLSRRKTRNGFS